MQITDLPLLINSAVADKPADPAHITTTSGFDAKHILGRVENIIPYAEALKNSLLRYFVRNMFFIYKKI